MTPIEHLERAVALHGSQAAMARDLDISAQHVNNWLKGKKLLPEWCKRIEQSTDRKIAELRAKGIPEDELQRVTRHDLDPDLFDPPCERCPWRERQDPGEPLAARGH